MKERILKIIEIYGLTKKEFAEKIGISTGNLSDLFSGRIKQLSPQVVTNIAKIFLINPTWLILGEGEMEFSSNNSLEKVQLREDIEFTRKILGDVQIRRIIETLLEIPKEEFGRIEAILQTFRKTS
ncbi:helix-turn-helix domain-containing protein [Leptospira santarosai]|uniref:helix-turn-helix domain-containing protein n=1 Tax=Leptospira santarosai TaxID=28183 RepID=UPI0024AECBE3|nr:helix-turn-helix transcriptional regulator [Leptospira santarosai]MDI7190863.1 helix-turn-helix transcriptional regulator [Leptospira santarosai]